MALLVSASCMPKSLLYPSSMKQISLKAPAFLFASERLPKRTQKFSPLHVAAPPSPSIQKEEEGEYKGDFRVDDESGEESSDSKFSWRDHWYPVSLVEDLDPSLPTPFQLLGRDLVLWFDKASQQWVAFDDKCPHRLAPLSVSL